MNKWIFAVVSVFFSASLLAGNLTGVYQSSSDIQPASIVMYQHNNKLQAMGIYTNKNAKQFAWKAKGKVSKNKIIRLNYTVLTQTKSPTGRIMLRRGKYNTFHGVIRSNDNKFQRQVVWVKLKSSSSVR